ncbi:uncharacterized protein METZ01_LOCUS100725, partial [marine metagenome]
MAVNLGKYPRYRQPPPIGKNTAKAPTREQVQRINPASDPGARGGPTDVPLGAFGGGEGLVDVGSAIAEAGINDLAMLAKAKAKTETIQLDNEVGNLSRELEGLNGKIFKDPTNGHLLLDYYEKSAQKTEEYINKIKGQNHSLQFKQFFELKARNTRDIANAATTKTVGEEQDKVIGFKMDAELSASTNPPQNRADVVSMVEQNRMISERYDQILPWSVRQEKLRAADLAVIVYRSDQYFKASNWPEARRVLTVDSNAVPGALLQKDKLERLFKIDEAEKKASIEAEKKKLEDDKNRYIDLKSGLGLYDKVDKKIVEGTEGIDPKKLTHFTDQGIFRYEEDTDTWKLVPDSEAESDKQKDFKLLEDSGLYSDDELKQLQHRMLTKDLITDTERQLARIEDSDYPEDVKKALMEAIERKAAGLPEDPVLTGTNKYIAEKTQQDLAAADYKFTPREINSSDVNAIGTIVNDNFEIVREGVTTLPHGYDKVIADIKRETESLYTHGDPNDPDPKKRHLGMHEAFDIAVERYEEEFPGSLPVRLNPVERFDRIIAPINTIPEQADK